MHKTLKRLKLRIFEGLNELLAYLFGLYILVSIIFIVIGVIQNDNESIIAGVVNILFAAFLYSMVKYFDKIKLQFKRVITNLYKYILIHKPFILYRIGWILTIAFGVWLGLKLSKLN